ncbi:MAG: patatin-like phospholipase family protein, partial [Gammaproteobacteria bacterium]|nr:patatin-like phospholipase family protein [Gammaproteobacteria bacterium]
SLTRENAIKTQIANIDVLTQRFFVPIELTVDASNKPVFKNYEAIHLNPGDFGNIVYLPQDANKAISKDLVIATALASSAFPVAFGRVMLDVCEQGALQTSAICPQGYFASSVVYVDGGIFDNIPLSTARLLAEDEKDENGKLRVLPYNKPVSYIYMSPSNLRFTDKRIPTDSESITPGADKKLSYGILDQLGFIDDTINIGMGSELYSTLRSYDWNNVDANETDLQKRYQNPSQKTHPRKLLLTSRGTPLTADYLSHFGAFAAREFREYDYYAGVYDGFYNTARSICNSRRQTEQNSSACITGIMLELHKKLELSSDKNAAYLFALLYQQEFCEASKVDALCYQSMPDKENSLHVLHRAMNDSTNLDFNALLQSLLPDRYAFKDASLHKMMLADSMWYIDYAKAITDRMQQLESRTSSGTEQKKLISLSSYIINSVDSTEDDFVWAVASAPSHRNNWVYLIPDEIGFDVSQSGSVFTYRIKGEPWIDQIYPELEASLHFVSDITDKNNFAHGGINLRKRVPGVFGLPVSSVGMGYGYYKDFTATLTSLQWEETPTNERAIINIGIFADKFRLTYGQKIHGSKRERDASHMIILSLTDIKGLLYWLF